MLVVKGLCHISSAVVVVGDKNSHQTDLWTAQQPLALRSEEVRCDRKEASMYT